MDARPRQRDAIDVPRARRHLHDVIVAYRAAGKDSLDRWALDVLVRLTDSSEAAVAFKRLRLKVRRDEAAILKACIEADQLARKLPEQIAKAKSILAQADALGKAVAELRGYVGALTEPPTSDLLSARILEEPDNIAAMKRGLSLIASRIKADQLVANETMLRLGVVRKNDEAAIQNAAIKWLADGVCRITKQPNRPIVASLANVVLNTDKVTEDRVRKATDFRQREWRYS
jgi:hypothetical protein